MTISYNWLKNYLPVELTPEEVSVILTAVGLEVESLEAFEKIKGGLKGLVVGEVLSCIPHPNAEKLKLTQVTTDGSNRLSIVCGAPNVAQGQKVIVATVGTTLYPLQGECFEIKKAKIRGEESEGMLCAEDEIGLGESHDGIMVLPEQTVVGTSAANYFNLPKGDWVYEIGLTPNRMEAMSHMGVVKDISAYLNNRNLLAGSSERIVMTLPKENALSFASKTTITFDVDQTICSRYCGICIEGIQVKESPEWLQLHLKAIGLKPINNIVDITNFVLHECGQPLHAFDLSAIQGNKIKVSTAAAGEKFVTLDGKEIALTANDIMIRNENEAMCIGGVYGGLHSGIKETTTALFLESACFDATHIRKTSTHHNLRTDAALRFEKGTDISQTIYALKRATQLILELAGGEITSELYDVYPKQKVAIQIACTYDRIRSLAGKHYSIDQIKTILHSLCFSILSEDENGFVVAVPFSKPDVTMVADIVEEIMRIDGLDQIPFTGKISYSIPAQTGYTPNFKQQFKEQLAAKGFYEIFTNSITNAAYYPNKENLVMMMNSLSANLDCMRPSMLETGLESIAHNLNRKNNHLKFFEFGKVYFRSNEQCVEEEKLVLYVSGNYRLPYYAEKAQQADMFYLKGIVESLLQGLKIEFKASDNFVDVLFQNKGIGKLTCVPHATLKQFDIKQEVWYAELNWDVLKSALQTKKTEFTEIPKFPTVQRDLAMIVKKETRYHDIQVAVKQAKSKLLQQMNLFDVFTHEKIGSENISYAVNFSFYDPSKTLTDVEVEADMKLIITSLENKVGAAIRSN